MNCERSSIRVPLFDHVEDLTVIGGEASLRTDIVDVVAYFAQRIPQVRTLSMVTNGFLPERIVEQTRAILKVLEPKGIRLSMSVSLDGIGPSHDKIRGVPGGFDKAMETLAGLRSLQAENDFWLGVGYVIMHETLGSALGFRDWAARQGLEVSFQIVSFHQSYVSNMDRQESVDFQPEDREELIAVMQQLARERSLANPAAYYWNDMVRMVRDGSLVRRRAHSRWKGSRWMPTAT